MGYKKPENLDTLSIEDLKALRDEAVTAARAIDESGDDLSAEQVASLESILDDVASIDEHISTLETAETERATRVNAARERMASLDAPAAEAADAAEEVAEETPEGDAAQDAPAAEEVAEPVLASGQKRPTVRAAAKKAPAVIINKEKEEAPVPLSTIVAAANVPDFTAGQTLADMSEVATAFLSRAASFGQNDPNMKPQVFQMSRNATHSAVARIRRKDREFVVDREQGVETQFQTIMEAAREARLSGGSVLAAGGWCAPSEIDYGFCELETTEGLIDVPEVTAKRGGISFTKGPDFMTLFGDSNFGFIQTEAVVEAGATPKPCYAVVCPSFSEVRMDAIGFCITAGLLTNSTYPELVRRILNLAGVGHARRKSASTISRITAAVGTAIDWAEVGGVGGPADVLDAVELQALRIRQSLAMSPTATIEGFAPYWLRPAMRAGLGRRLGIQEPFRIADSDVDAYFATRNIRLQYVYDYQMLDTTNTATWTKYPDTVEITLYPAGAFVRLANGVINLDAVYDHDMLTGNQYTAAFMEEGIAVANTCGFGVRVSVGLNYEGAAGFPQIGAGAGVTFASV